MRTSLLIRGWAVGEAKHKFSQCSSWVLQPEKMQSVWGYTPAELECLGHFFLPPISVPLSCCDFECSCSLCFWRTLSSLPQAAKRNPPVPSCFTAPTTLCLYHAPQERLLPPLTLFPSYAFCFPFCWAFASRRTPLQATEVLSAVGPGEPWPCRAAHILLCTCSDYRGGGWIPPGLSKRLTTNVGRDKGSN